YSALKHITAMSDLRSSAFSYPSPATKIQKTDISLREILETYRDNNDLLRQILTAKAEEDKRRAEEEKHKTEALRLQCKQVELEMLKEQKKPPTIFTGVPPINTSSSFNSKSPSDIHSPYLPIPPPIDTHFPATTPTSATRLSPPSSANNGHDSISYNHNGISSQNHSYNSASQRPSLTLSIPPFPIITSSPTTMHSQHSFSTPTSSVHDHPHSASSQTHHRYTQSPTTINGNNKRPKLNSESEVDHEYVMEALRQKVQRNQENPAKKYMNVLKPRSVSTPVVSHNNPSPSHPQHHSRDQPKHQQQTASPIDPPMARSPIPPLPPMNVHSPGINQEQVTKS
ncbi:10520_t:CDS:2, partial [Acaulospora morrowiae]